MLFKQGVLHRGYGWDYDYCTGPYYKDEGIFVDFIGSPTSQANHINVQYTEIEFNL
jgi:hypothetical protein